MLSTFSIFLEKLTVAQVVLSRVVWNYKISIEFDTDRCPESIYATSVNHVSFKSLRSFSINELGVELQF
jgi:hypothetical protein